MTPLPLHVRQQRAAAEEAARLAAEEAAGAEAAAVAAEAEAEAAEVAAIAAEEAAVKMEEQAKWGSGGSDGQADTDAAAAAPAVVCEGLAEEGDYYYYDEDYEGITMGEAAEEVTKLGTEEFSCCICLELLHKP